MINTVTAKKNDYLRSTIDQVTDHFCKAGNMDLDRLALVLITNQALPIALKTADS